eukprot:m51a1_g14604 hypothetical protein (189) ;mRNA; r:1193918-1194690
MDWERKHALLLERYQCLARESYALADELLEAHAVIRRLRRDRSLAKAEEAASSAEGQQQTGPPPAQSTYMDADPGSPWHDGGDHARKRKRATAPKACKPDSRKAKVPVPPPVRDESTPVVTMMPPPLVQETLGQQQQQQQQQQPKAEAGAGSVVASVDAVSAAASAVSVASAVGSPVLTEPNFIDVMH